MFIDQNGQHLSISSEVIQRLGDLEGRRIITFDDARHGSMVRKDTASLLRAADGRRMPNAGLFQALQFGAYQRGIRLHRRVAPAIVVLPNPIQLKFLSYPQVAQFVCDKWSGQIGIHPGIKPEDIVADLHLAFPDSSVVVLGRHIRQLKRIADSLRARRVHATAISSRYQLRLADDADDDEPPRVICSTPREAGSIDFSTASIVVLLDAPACQHSDMQMTLSQVDAQFRLFGLIDVTKAIAPSVVDSIMSTFGPDIIRLQSRLHIRRDVNAAWVPVPPPNNALEVTDPRFARHCYWYHDRRNRRIKQLANGLRTGCPLSQRKFGDLERLYGQSGYTPPSVTVLVDRPVHAVELSRLLPNWPIIASDAALEGLDSSFCDFVWQSRRQWIDGSHQIVLAEAALQFRGETSDVVIWVGGGESTDFMPHNWLSVAYGSSRPLLIIDFQDNHNLVTRELSHSRQQQYLQSDIFPVGISAAQGRLAMFLNRQRLEVRHD